MEKKIPKIIHYCWFGGEDKPAEIKKCMETWKLLDDYEVVEWNESNCSFSENEFVKKAFREKRWAFVSDYYRLKALYEYGGIYFDTDVKVIKKMDSLLSNECFMGFMVNSCIGTAVIGSCPNNIHIKNILEMYEKTEFVENWIDGIKEDKLSGQIFVSEFHTNNYYINRYLTRRVDGFIANNKYQKLNNLTIYPKEIFEIGKLFGTYYTIHINLGSWKNSKPSSNISNKVKKVLETSEYIYSITQIIIRKRRYYKMNKKISKMKF